MVLQTRLSFSEASKKFLKLYGRFKVRKPVAMIDVKTSATRLAKFRDKT
jgi:hypothetical protein